MAETDLRERLEELPRCISACREKLPLGIKHGICYTCAEELRRELRAERAAREALEQKFSRSRQQILADEAARRLDAAYEEVERLQSRLSAAEALADKWVKQVAQSGMTSETVRTCASQLRAALAAVSPPKDSGL